VPAATRIALAQVNLADQAAVPVALAPDHDHGPAQHQRDQARARFRAEPLFFFRRVDSREPHPVRPALVVEHRQRVPVGYAGYRAEQLGGKRDACMDEEERAKRGPEKGGAEAAG